MEWKVFAPDFDPEGLDLKGLTPIKDRGHRRLWRWENYLIKGFRKTLLKPDPALREVRLAQKLKGLTPQVVAYGQEKDWRYVVTRWIEGKELSKYLENYLALSREEKNNFLRKLAFFLTELFRKGLFQPDFHLANILIDTQRNLWAIDFQRAWLVTYNERRLSRQLAYLLPPLRDYLSWWEIGRLTSFLAQGIPALRRKDFRLGIQKRASILWQRHFYKKGKKLRLSQKKDRGERVAGELVLKERLPQIIKETKIFKDSRTAKSGLSENFFVKIYLARNFLHGLLRSLVGSRAWKTFWKAYQLKLRGILTPLPLLVWERKWKFKGIQAVLLYPYEPGLRIGWHERWRAFSPAERSNLLRQVVCFLWEIHEKGVFHGDAKLSNFFQKEGLLGLFDLDRTRFVKFGLPRDKRLKDLAHLAFSFILLEPEKEESLCREIFSYYAFLAPELKNDYLRFKKLVSRRLIKRRLRETLPVKG